MVFVAVGAFVFVPCSLTVPFSVGARAKDASRSFLKAFSRYMITNLLAVVALHDFGEAGGFFLG